jgi:hypothetical protein
MNAFTRPCQIVDFAATMPRALQRYATLQLATLLPIPASTRLTPFARLVALQLIAKLSPVTREPAPQTNAFIHQCQIVDSAATMPAALRQSVILQRAISLPIPASILLTPFALLVASQLIAKLSPVTREHAPQTSAFIHQCQIVDSATTIPAVLLQSVIPQRAISLPIPASTRPTPFARLVALQLIAKLSPATLQHALQTNAFIH